MYLENMKTSYLDGVADGCSEEEGIQTQLVLAAVTVVGSVF